MYRAELAISALLGSIIADAATMPLHWIYDTSKLRSLVESEQHSPAFFVKPSSPFYGPSEFPGHYNVGQLSPYGEQHVALLQFMRLHHGNFIGGKEFSEFFAIWAQNYTGRKDHPTKEFEKIFSTQYGKYPNCGANDDQANAFLKVVPITMRYAGRPELEPKIREAILVQQNHERSVAYGVSFARILEAIILGANLEQALARGVPEPGAIVQEQYVNEIKEWIQIATENRDKIDTSFVEKISEKIVTKDTPEAFRKVAALSCGLPQSYVLSIKMLYSSHQDPKKAYEESVIENILVGGDNASRACFIGSVLAALGGTDSIPKSWKQKTSNLSEIEPIGSLIVQAATLCQGDY